MKREREIFATKVGDQENGDGVQEDEVVKYLVRIDEMNQKISELEYMLGEAI